MVSERRGSLTQNRRKYAPFFSHMILVVVYPGHGIFYPLAVYFSPNQVLAEVFKAPKLKGSIRKKVMPLYRSTRSTLAWGASDS